MVTLVIHGYNDSAEEIDSMLDWVITNPYIGNMPHDEGSKTICPECGAVLIDRNGFSSTAPGMKDGHCGKCGRKIEGAFSLQQVV